MTLTGPSRSRSQRNWIGRSISAEVDFKVVNYEETIRVFTTRPDTLFGATYMVLAPEHPLVDQITTATQTESVATYVKAASLKSDLDRTDLAKDKSGVFTGAYAQNPVNGAEVPVWIADYVLGHYGTGAIMAVPAHDSRDWEFARAFDLPITPVVSGPDGAEPDIREEAWTKDGTAINSGQFDGMSTSELKPAITTARSSGAERRPSLTPP